MNSACASPRQRVRTCTRRRPHEPRRGARRAPHFHARGRLMPALHSAARHSTRVRHPHIASSPAHARHPHPRSAPRPAHAKPRCGPTLSGPAVGGRARAPGAGSRSRDGAQLSSTRGNARYVYPAHPRWVWRGAVLTYGGTGSSSATCVPAPRSDGACVCCIHSAVEAPSP